jgi:hypothetical protein
MEQLPVAGGGDLVTVFGRLPGQSDEIPMLSVLRDTLGDPNPDNDRLRYVWVLTSARPSLLNRAAGSLPFFYWRPDFGKNADQQPVPVIDLGAASRGVSELMEMQTRLTLAGRSMGGLVGAAASIAGEADAPLFQTAAGKTGTLTGKAMWQQDAYRMIQRRTRDTGIKTRIGNHTFRATGITAYLKNKGTLEAAQHIANHESPRTTKLYDRRQDEISLDEVERIAI